MCWVPRVKRGEMCPEETCPDVNAESGSEHPVLPCTERWVFYRSSGCTMTGGLCITIPCVGGIVCLWTLGNWTLF